jgi:hypothetical protein
MVIKLLETVVLTKDLPEHHLKSGDIGAVVEVYSADAYEVEFVTGSGHTQALITLRNGDVRPVGSEDILAVRQVNAA